ncbi:MAG TPA: hypothetical protein VFE60_19545, partial [Roseiarcus sp.]|nr:hypothetical protein [Roseiarcus sp.]
MGLVSTTKARISSKGQANPSKTAWFYLVLYQSPESATRARDFRIGKGLIQGGERRRFAMAVPLRADFDAVGVRC